MGPRLQGVLERFRARKRLGLARAISLVEDESAGFEALLHALLIPGLQARRLGITGPPGAGKSTLVATLAARFREEGEEVGVVAVDPSSPYSGGALLGDRIRMNELATDPGTFIRSMATRGSLGGLATSTREVVDLMDAYGFPRVLVETVGVGQAELEIVEAADTVVVVLVPESGDGIQAMKAGLMEIADVFVVNKADRPGADRLVKEIRLSLELRSGEGRGDVPAHHGVDLSRVGTAEEEGGSRPPEKPVPAAWEAPVVKTVAQSGEGTDALLEAVDRHRRHLEESGELERRRRDRARTRVREVVEREMRRIPWRNPRSEEILKAGLEGIRKGEATPYSVAREIVDAVGPGGGSPR